MAGDSGPQVSSSCAATAPAPVGRAPPGPAAPRRRRRRRRRCGRSSRRSRRARRRPQAALEAQCLGDRRRASWWMPWLWLHTCRLVARRRSTGPAAQLGAIEAWARKGLEYDAVYAVGVGRARRRATAIGSCGPARSQSARSSSSGRLSCSCQVAAAASRSRARSTSASPLADDAEERAVAHQGRRRGVRSRRRRCSRRAGRDGGRSTRPCSSPLRAQVGEEARPAEHLVGQVEARRRCARPPAAAPGSAGRPRVRSVSGSSAAIRVDGSVGQVARPGLRPASARRRRRGAAPGPVWRTERLPAVRPWSGPSTVWAGRIRELGDRQAERVGGDLAQRGEDALAELDLADMDGHAGRRRPRARCPAGGWSTMWAGRVDSADGRSRRGLRRRGSRRRCAAGRRSGTGCAPAPRRPARRVGCGSSSSRAAARTTMPEMQKPHCAAWWSRIACCTGCGRRRRTGPRPW